VSQLLGPGCGAFWKPADRRFRLHRQPELPANHAPCRHCLGVPLQTTAARAVRGWKTIGCGHCFARRRLRPCFARAEFSGSPSSSATPRRTSRFSLVPPNNRGQIPERPAVAPSSSSTTTQTVVPLAGTPPPGNSRITRITTPNMGMIRPPPDFNWIFCATPQGQFPSFLPVFVLRSRPWERLAAPQPV